MIDFMVTEAVSIKVMEEDKRAQEELEKEKWKGNTDHLRGV